MESAASKQFTNENSAARASMGEAVQNMKKAAGNVKDAARSVRSEAGEDVSAYIAQGQEKFNEYSSKAEKFAREKPLYVAGGAFVAGWLISRMFKS